MQSTDLQADQSVIRRTLLALGMGVVLGFQGWRVATALAAPWYGATWIWLGHLFLGVSIGITAGLACWWKRGIGLGLAFGLASAFGGWILGMKWVPFGIASITASLIAAVLMALIADAVFPLGTPSRDRKQGSNRDQALRVEPARVPRARTAVGDRLASEKMLLENLELERARKRRPGFGKAAEDRIVWSELLELEIQDIDERLQGIRHEAEQPRPKHPPNG